MAGAKKSQGVTKTRAISILGGVLCLVLIYILGFSNFHGVEYNKADAEGRHATTTAATPKAPALPPLDKAAYDKKLLSLANRPVLATTTASTTTNYLWPVTAAYPNPGAILPFKRIVAYYGNFYSKGMGVLGEYPLDQVAAKLRAAVAEWQVADPATPVVPAIDYIAITAQASPGADGKYRFRMPDSQIQIALDLASQVNGIVFLDLQVGLSSLPVELPLIEKYLKMPQVHLALDPEFAMHNGAKPGTVVGTMSASDINYAADYLAKLVRENNLPPKVLVIHRFTHDMVTGYKSIKPLPEVQMVMDMDGWGSPAKKIGTYTRVIAPEPVQFTGFKIFYKNDLKPPSTRIMTPAELLKLSPQPSYIQYQ
ncbi:MAG: hypothetical protein WDN10_04965 [bacterium]